MSFDLHETVTARLGKLHGRFVSYIDLKCSDCTGPAKVMVCEQDGRNWFWCTECDIGISGVEQRIAR